MPDPGWYDDPHDGSKLRWWNGTTWTDHQAPSHTATPSGVAPPGPAGMTVPTPMASGSAIAGSTGTPIQPDGFGGSVKPQSSGLTKTALVVVAAVGAVLVLGVGAIVVALSSSSQPQTLGRACEQANIATMERSVRDVESLEFAAGEPEEVTMFVAAVKGLVDELKPLYRAYAQEMNDPSITNGMEATISQTDAAIRQLEDEARAVRDGASPPRFSSTPIDSAAVESFETAFLSAVSRTPECARVRTLLNQ